MYKINLLKFKMNPQILKFKNNNYRRALMVGTSGKVVGVEHVPALVPSHPSKVAAVFFFFCTLEPSDE